ncbi:MAG: ribonucleotide-diphosphate reductase subunit beta, partial [Neobacillus sp.]
METRRRILTTSTRGLLEDSFPYRLYQKAKRIGTWNPADIDFSQDQRDWKTLNLEQQADILRLISQFQAGEEAVTLDLLPLIMAIAKEGRLEEEMFLTTFLYEEAKHTEFFRLVLNAIGEKGDLSYCHTPTYKKIFYEILPTTMECLIT